MFNMEMVQIFLIVFQSSFFYNDASLRLVPTIMKLLRSPHNSQMFPETLC